LDAGIAGEAITPELWLWVDGEKLPHEFYGINRGRWARGAEEVTGGHRLPPLLAG